jgi:membrane associated rhomboid family serine protease
MESKTFGRRGLNTRAGVAVNATARGLRSEGLTDGGAVSRSMSVVSEQSSAFDQVPLLTIALAIAFFIGYAIQARLAFRVQNDGKFDLSSLMATGAVGYDLVFLKGEWWRIFLAPLLHASISHQIGNTVALVVAGFRLEPMVGRA